jgi:hypothetical protein
MDEGLKNYREEMKYFRRIGRCGWCGRKQARWRRWLRFSYCRPCRSWMRRDFEHAPVPYLSVWEADVGEAAGDR